MEGRFPVFGPEMPTLSNYMNKNRNISFRLAARRADSHDRPDADRRNFIVTSTLNAVRAARYRLQKKKINVDFEQLLQDVERAGQRYTAIAGDPS